MTNKDPSISSVLSVPSRPRGLTAALALTASLGWWAACAADDGGQTPGASGEAGSEKRAPTDAEMAALPADDLMKLLEPLRRLANAVEAVGRTDAADVYSGIELDARAGTVSVYLTDQGRADSILGAASALDAGIDVALARIRPAQYTRFELHSARDRLLAAAGQMSFKIESIAVPPNGAALHLRVDDVAQADRAMTEPLLGTDSAGLTAASMVGVPVDLAPAEGGRDMSRFKDSPFWIAGEYIQDGVSACTSGIPAQRISDNHWMLVTAAHCFPNNRTVTTGAVNGTANRIGTVVARANLADAIAIDTTSTGATFPEEWDGKNTASFVLPLRGSAFSFNGDSVCQDGYPSGVVCGIVVNNGDITWTGSNGVVHRGVEGHTPAGRTAIQPGDSGGLVFAIVGSSSQPRQVRGIGSFGGGTLIRWTEAPDIYASLGLRLAP